MDQAASAVHTIEVTRAVRDAEVDEVSVTRGQMMGIYDGDVVVATDSADEAVLRSLDPAPVDALEIVTIYYGADATEADAQALAGRFREAHPGLDVEVVEVASRTTRSWFRSSDDRQSPPIAPPICRRGWSSGTPGHGAARRQLG